MLQFHSKQWKIYKFKHVGLVSRDLSTCDGGTPRKPRPSKSSFTTFWLILPNDYIWNADILILLFRVTDSPKERITQLEDLLKSLVVNPRGGIGLIWLLRWEGVKQFTKLIFIFRELPKSLQCNVQEVAFKPPPLVKKVPIFPNTLFPRL